MLQRVLYAGLLLLLTAGGAGAGDLYLLNVANDVQLDIVTRVLPSAHGMLGGRFLVDMTDDQATILNAAGVEIERVVTGFASDRQYLAARVRPGLALKELGITPLYSSGLDYIVESAPSELDALRKQGYLLVSIGELETPFFHHPPLARAGFLESYPSDTLADLIVQDSLYSYDTHLEAFQTRYIYSAPVMDARDWLVAKFQEFGYTDVSYDTFNFNSQQCHNVICVKPGSAEPDKVIVIGGHYDSINFDSDALVYAPGADDNASGTAVVLELARILKDVDTKKTIVFVAFSAEEVGLVGSEVIANQMYNDGVDIEVMLNFDMVAYTEGSNLDVKFFTGPFTGYADVFASAATRVTTLNPVFAGAASNSDHASFVNYGYHAAYTQEGIFNFDGWHTDLDISSRLDFAYFEQVVRMTAAAYGMIDNAAHLTEIETVSDAGNGAELLVSWTDCNPTYTYQVVYGISSGEYTDTVDAGLGTCSFLLSGLTAGQPYYISVLGINPEGYGPLFLDEVQATPYVIPQSPQGVSAEPAYLQIALSWHANRELDLHHYRVIRKDSLNDWAIVHDNVTDTTFSDMTVEGHRTYAYVVLAVDNDANVSDSSLTVSTVAATFDGGVLFVDETSAGGSLNPTETAQAAFYDSIFAESEYDKLSISISTDKLKRTTAGQYNSIYWFDDDINVKNFAGSRDSVAWFLDYPTNLVLGGWMTLYDFDGGTILASGDFSYDAFHITQISMQDEFDFAGAAGVGNWPDLQFKAHPLFGNYLPSICTFDILPDVDVVATFNSVSGDPLFDGKPVAVAYDNGTGRRIALGFPVYYLTKSSGEALLAAIRQYFESGSADYRYGDANNDEAVNLLDILLLIQHVYNEGGAPDPLNSGDANGDCAINLLDILFLIEYIYDESGIAPVAGCVE
ncbi:MAG: M20/M25/M40 family metallo-hydrolase [candidate division Zixibacteria bacterium]|nr:M20/M25/M40 family metallo-hydrolase [candidate division Zixibacteria bacterium]